MNNEQKKLIEKFTMESDYLLHTELSTDENKDYRRGFYAGRLFAALSIKNFLTQIDGIDVMKIDFE